MGHSVIRPVIDKAPRRGLRRDSSRKAATQNEAEGGGHDSTTEGTVAHSTWRVSHRLSRTACHHQRTPSHCTNYVSPDRLPQLLGIPSAILQRSQRLPHSSRTPPHTSCSSLSHKSHAAFHTHCTRTLSRPPSAPAVRTKILAVRAIEQTPHTRLVACIRRQLTALADLRPVDAELAFRGKAPNPRAEQAGQVHQHVQQPQPLR